MKRSKPPKRGKPLRRVNPKRKAANWLRAYGSEERVIWMQQQPCVVCGRGPCEGHHTINGGKGRKADACFIVPLCAVHHREWHSFGSIWHNKIYYSRITLADLSVDVDARWQQHLLALAGGP